ncbi:LamG-like jellyroll fold domain-containing protein [Mangrovimonas aestuarii]|uniref:LamG-like jellyroll fold domain-containing protein n=1 Tax=Mangrovimonas aestuarii TaxID=3018443 RepID=UPI002379C235|nr:LamG-like jellyroll fold domain-containing protein [Mangrovimonas aestuarii]
MKKQLLSLKTLFCALSLTGLASTAQNGLNFDGVDDKIQTSFSGVLGTNNRTFEAWVYVPSTAPASNLAIMDYGVSSVGSRNTFMVAGDRSLKFISGGTNANISTAAFTVPEGTWTHVAFVLNSGTGSLYINGAVLASGSLSAVNTPSGNENVIIGERVSGGSTLFNGDIDEVRIWDVARTETEIQASMNEEVCESTSGLVAYYKLNEGTAGVDNTGITTATDLVDGNDGTLSGFGLTSGNTSNWVTGKDGLTTFSIDNTVSSDDTTLTANQAGATYQWVDVDNANAPIADETNQTFTPSASGNYAVEITAGGCVETSETIAFTAQDPIESGISLNFDGVDDYVQTTCPGVANNGARTVEAWIKTTKNSNPSEGGSQSVIVDWGSTTNGKRFTFNILWGNAIRLEVAGAGLNGTVAVNDGNWHHVAVTFNPSGNTMSLYVDGVLDTSGIMSTVNTGTATNVRIGSRIDNVNPFEGSIDEVRIWDVARTQAEIQADMNNELCDDTPNLIGYYKLNEGTADSDNTGVLTANDDSGDNNGTLNGFALTTGSTSNWTNGASVTAAASIDATVSSDDSTLTANQTGATYQWLDSALEPILGETNQTFTPSADGNYAVEITMGGCVETSETVAFTTQDPIEQGISLNFDGTNDYIQTTFDGTGVLGNSPRTIEAWIKIPSTSSSDARVIADYGKFSNAEPGKRFTFNVNPNHLLRIEVEGWGFNGTTALNDNLWHHVAVTYDGTNFSLYVDGVIEGSPQQALTTVQTTAETDLMIGSRIDEFKFFQGSIDEVRVWSEARSLADLTANMNNELCENTPNLVAYYKLNEGIVNGENTATLTAIDNTGSNNGTLNGFALTTGSTSNWTNGAGLTTAVTIDATISSDDTTLTANQAGATYQWVDVDNANAPIADETNQTFSPTVNGNYAVEITLGGCTETSETVNFTTLGLNDNVFSNNIRLYPNPTSNYINVNLGDTYITVNASLLSVNGRVVAQKTVSNTSAFQMDLNQAAGLYFLNITTDNGKSAILKVVKK